MNHPFNIPSILSLLSILSILGSGCVAPDRVHIHRKPVWEAENAPAAPFMRKGKLGMPLEQVFTLTSAMMEQQGMRPAVVDQEGHRLYSEYFYEGPKPGYRNMHLLLAALEQKKGYVQVSWYLCPPSVSAWRYGGSGRGGLSVVRDVMAEDGTPASAMVAPAGATPREAMDYQDAFLDYARSELGQGKVPVRVIKMDQKAWTELQDDWNYRLWRYVVEGAGEVKPQ